ncbi:MAG: S9 family peptidase, partial [Bacteroidetes bacterium]|nr:S9 family peptidase [Bacteroidota bacterium]
MKKAILSIVILFVFIGNSEAQKKKRLNMKPSVSQTAKKNFTLEQIWGSGEFAAAGVSGFQPMIDGETYCKLDYDTAMKQFELNQYFYKNGKKKGLVCEDSYIKSLNPEKPLSLSGYKFSPDEKLILIESEHEQIYRHSYKAKYAIYDRVSRKTYYISNQKGMYPTFSPDCKSIAWVRDNNLYIINLENMMEIAVTLDGKRNEIINGAVDWVYEEEFSMDKGFSWSPDSKNIIYYRFDESKVKEYTMPVYGGLYPVNETFKYPKAGEDNSKVEVYIYHVESKNSSKVDVGSESDQYIPRIFWTGRSDRAGFFRLNRLQNKLELMYADLAGASKVVYTETSVTYVDLFDDITFINEGKNFIWSSEKSEYKHIHLYDENGTETKQITTGDFDVSEFLGFDEKTQTIYYTAHEISAIDKNLYSIKIDGTGKKRLTLREGTNNIAFSSNYKYFLCTHSTINTPYFVTLYNNQGVELRILEDNSKLTKKLQDYRVSEAKFFQVTTSELLNLNAFIILPPDLDTLKKYPVLMFVYGGPGSQQVVDAWKGSYYFWFQYLAQQGYIVVCADNRGTGARGEIFKKMTYKNLGYYETIDQIEVAKWLADQPNIDASRIGIMGWSFGGYMSSMCITRGADVFKAAVAVAPVTNWKYYDNIYTERYMQRPVDNKKGYDEGAPENYVKNIKGNFLIIHGTADDNVHFQNAASMVDAMIKNNIKFDSEYYPNKNHGIS